MDVENASQRTGYPELAHRIAICPDYETFIFRRFDALSARNLLYLESRLAYLEWQLAQADDQAALSPDNETRRSTRAWEAFAENAKDPRRPEHAKMKLVEEINHALKEYQEALLRQSQMASLEAPRYRALEVARGLSQQSIKDSSGNIRSRSLLAGLAEHRLAVRNTHDLAAVRRPADKDPLSRFLQEHWMFKTTKITDETEYIQENHVAWVAAILSIIDATFLLVGAIVCLRFLQNENAQLGVIALFMVLFAVSVGILTNARRAEIFASTAAYAAVLVVFISLDSSG
ncbi:hypothetical protein B0I35DRAFT_431974 [Stachybotrys elegans]|uniref:DUF6594 domain-containing protein n=1 Tax=Stachybotrys elegans TaxID=80388 RepID=A0A8K0SPW8_9HYPO|nr:hypothetical protein B0I35DRAFT_431974 [Stachybotrys elegans]